MAADHNTLAETFIARWQNNAGGAERANYALFLTELCDVIGVARPDPASHETEFNEYAFERGVTKRDGGERVGSGRIDLYKRGSFVLEAKQSRWKDGKKSVPGQTDMFSAESEPKTRSRSDRNWDVLMMNARRQAEDYAKALPASDGWPPFVIVCDVGYCLEIYADFSGQGKNYAQFPDRQRFRVFLDDLRQEDVRGRLKAIWETPLALDPSKEAVKASRKIAGYLAEVTKRLEKAGHNPEEVATFLMRCLFTMFSEDMELLPKHSFSELLKRCIKNPENFVRMVGQLWQAMDKGEFAYGIEKDVRKFNGNLFKDAKVFALDKEDIGALLTAAEADWTEVDPSIFGTLLEQALDAKERSKLGAHYTPRAYVERLVIATIMEPLRADWNAVKSTAERQKLEGYADGAVTTVRGFHEKLYETRVLDPACGTGNFLYVSLELMKRLEGEVLEALADLGGQEALRGLDRHEVDPHQFLGLELNARARHIAELVLWIGFLQWHKRNRGELPGDPVLRDYGNIKQGDAVLTWDGYPVPKIVDGKETLPRPRRPDWPEAEFIVGNPPFIGKGEPMRRELGDLYVETLWTAHPWMNDSADFVMYWWDRSAELLTRKSTKLRRFGLVTTNSITQVFNRRTIQRYQEGKDSFSLVMAVPDHPWYKRSSKEDNDPAAVRIAMTVAEASKSDGLLFSVISETDLDTDDPKIEYQVAQGRVNSDLTVGVDLTSVGTLQANDGIACNGMMLAGRGFVLTPSEREVFISRDGDEVADVIRPFINGGELVRHWSGRHVIDLFGMNEDEVRQKFPAIFQHMLQAVKPERSMNRREAFRKRWWVFGEPRRTFRPALVNLKRFIGTTETSKHRLFQFIEAKMLPDHMIIAIASADGFHLGVLSSRFHVPWAMGTGGWLGIGNDPRYSKSRCFDPFPFPECDEAAKARIRALAEEIDAHRKRAQAEHGVTLTQMYNVLEKVRGGFVISPLEGEMSAKPTERGAPAQDGAQPSTRATGSPGHPSLPVGISPSRGEIGSSATSQLTPAEHDIFDRALILTLKHLHDELDAAVADAYGWPRDLPEAEVLARLVALNKERAAEEARGLVRWLRPDYQIPRFGSVKEKAELELVGGAGEGMTEDKAASAKPNFPTKDIEQTVAVTMALVRATTPLSAAEIARQFKQGKKIENRIEFTLKAMARMGEVSVSGQRFILKRAA